MTHDAKMYEKFYGFTENPFNMTPDSKYFYPSEEHQEALDRLIYAINERKGFVVITGEIGSGKTTICRTLLNQLNADTDVALIFNTHITCKELIANILDDLGVEYKNGPKSKLLSQLNNYLINQLSRDRNVVVIIDEAQNLSQRVLEEVRMLSNLETEKQKLLQVILMGQPELKEKLRQKSLEQFKQRIWIRYHIEPLTMDEVTSYINHRLHIAGANGEAIFNEDAVESIYQWSKGIPRLINFICDNALLSGYVYNTKTIDKKIIEEVIKEKEI